MNPMKKLLVYFLFFLTGSLYSQDLPEYNWKDLSNVASIKSFDFEINFEHAEIMWLKHSEYVKIDPEWSLYESRFLAQFIGAFNAEANIGSYPHFIANGIDSEFKMVLQISNVTDGGSHIYGNLFIFNPNGQILFWHPVESKKGRIGSVCKLMGFSFIEMGHNVGRKFYYYSHPPKRK